MTPDPKQLAVLLDMAREVYGDNAAQVRWLEHPETVQKLLNYSPFQSASDSLCVGCSTTAFHNGMHGVHDKTCHILLAWQLLGDQRAARNIEGGYVEALVEQSRRTRRVHLSRGTIRRQLRQTGGMSVGDEGLAACGGRGPVAHQGTLTSDIRCEQCEIIWGRAVLNSDGGFTFEEIATPR